MSLVYNVAYRKKKKIEPAPDIDYLYFTSSEPFSVTLGTTGNKKWDGILESSTDKHVWTVVTAGEMISCIAGTSLYFRGTNNTHFATAWNWDTISRFSLSGENIECHGNIETLLDYQMVQAGNHPPMANYCFVELFSRSSALITAPELPAVTLSESCYGALFFRCSNLVVAPALPATTLAASCYYQMFAYCTNLVVPPALPASEISESCYTFMFDECSSLRILPALPATTLPGACYKRMFEKCQNIGIYNSLSTDHNISYCIPYKGSITSSRSDAVQDMFADTVGNVAAPSLNTTYYVYSVIEPDGTILTSESEPAHIYGASWDGTSITKKWTRTDEAADFTDPAPYVSGATEYGSPFDDLYPWKNMTIVEDDNAGIMVKIPKFWYKLTQNGAGMSIQIADKEVEGYSVCPACMDRGDGNGERDYILIGRYHCASSTYKSKTGERPAAKATRAVFCTGIQALGTGIYMTDWAARFTIWLLYLVEFADWNSQATIGYGCGNNSSTENMGYTDSMPYHTGTTQSSRTIYGLGTQYRNIEGLWDNVKDFVDGCYNASTGLNIILDPTKFSDSENGISVGTPTSSTPAAFSVKTIDNTFPLFIPSANGTYVDTWYFHSSSPIIIAGGNYYRDNDSGMFFFGNASETYTHPSVGSRPMKLPNFTNN